MSKARPPVSIFYDLETSDANPIGQILNYAFIALDANWNVVGELTGDIRISRLQLPRAGAILANRVQVLEHQELARETELEAMKRIQAFFESTIQQAGGPVVLAGYNSDSFDLPYLRTSLIRNGINPYLQGNLIYKDLLIASRKLSVSHSEFPRLPNPLAADRLSLRLETLTQAFGLLEGAQTHTSLDDVRLTVDLARLYQEKFNLDVRLYEGYEALPDPPRGEIVNRLEPEYDLKSEARWCERPYILLDADYRQALWVDLSAYAEGKGRSSIRYRRKKCGEFFFEYGAVPTETLRLGSAALEEFKGVTVKNYFTKSSCDIEQDIYRMDFDQLDMLTAALHTGNVDLIKKSRSRECKVLHIRHKLANVPAGENADPAFIKTLKQYAVYRYGGALQLSKFADQEPEYHPTACAMLEEIKYASESGSAEDIRLLDALETFYRESELFAVAGTELGVTTS